MTIVIHASGGVRHDKELSAEKQSELAAKVALVVKAALEANCANGSGTVTVGTRSATFNATTSFTADT